MSVRPPAVPDTEAPVQPVQPVQQQGGANVVAQADIETRGISVESAAPLGLTAVLVLLLALIVYLSHRREVLRLDTGREADRRRSRKD